MTTPHDVLRQILAGELDVARLTGLSKDDVAQIAALGARKLAGGHAVDAAAIFAALEAIEPREPMHSFHRAVAAAAAGADAEAVDACSRFLDEGDRAAPADVARALLLRASLRPASDKRLADSDLAAAKFLAMRDEEARAVVEGRAR